MIPMLIDMWIIHMENKVIGSLMILSVGKTQTEMATLIKMIYSLMISHSGMILMVMVMVIISMELMVMYSLMILMNGRIQMKME